MNETSYCDYCGRPHGDGRQFCDDTCRGEYLSECVDNQMDQLPGESRYAGWDYEPEEWDVIGGL